ncbi:MAG: helix-turn-helix domain-containing protein, partial [Limnohabitans sp.]|nr:helix-turn-helix domain-containing protein [Limnohabitans sp.]
MRKSSYTRLSLEERVEIQVQLSRGRSYGQIALALGRSKSNIQRAVAPWTRDRYQAVKANEYAQKGAQARKSGKFKINFHDCLRDYIFAKRNVRWFPKQICNIMRTEYPDDKTMQITGTDTTTVRAAFEAEFLA